MSSWREMPLGDVCELKRGYDLPNGARRAGSIPVVSSSGPTGWHDEAKVSAPGVVTGRYGTLGQVFYLTEDFWPLNTALYVRDFKGNDPRFVAILLRSMNLAQYDGAAAVPGLNRNQLHTVAVNVPDLPVQRAIAEVVEAFDDLIANNRRRVEVLEEMARTIYREWFVKFRYTGHEDVPLVGSAFGPIPSGWEVRTLGDVSTILDRLRRPLSKMQRAQRRGSIPYYGAAKLIDFVDDWIFDGEYLLFAEDGSVAKSDGFPILQMIRGRFWANNHTHILEGAGVSTRFLRLASERVQVRPYVTGAAQPKITQANLKSIPVVVGTPSVHAALDSIIDPLYDDAYSIAETSDYLVGLRDLLLPKLVTGQIDVSALDLDALIEGQVA